MHTKNLLIAVTLNGHSCRGVHNYKLALVWEAQWHIGMSDVIIDLFCLCTAPCSIKTFVHVIIWWYTVLSFIRLV